MVNVYGVAVVMLPGYSWMPHSSIDYVVNVGTARDCPSFWPVRSENGQVRRRLRVT